MSAKIFKSISFGFLAVLVAISPAQALTVGKLYEYCKPYADRGFELKNEKDVACLMYFQGISDAVGQLCHYAKDKEFRDMVKAEVNELGLVGLDSFFETFSSDSFTKNRNAVIQKFINLAKDDPDDWGFTASSLVFQAANKMSSCKPTD